MIPISYPVIIASATVVVALVAAYLLASKRRTPAARSTNGRPPPRFIALETTKEIEERKKIQGTTDGTLPGKVSAEDILAKKQKATAAFSASLRDHGFAVVKLSPTDLAVFKALQEAAWKYFALDQTTRDANKDPDDNNLGYVKCGVIREYLKLRPTDPKNLWPSSDKFQQSFDAFFKRFNTIVWGCFLALARTIEENTQKQLFGQKEIEAIAEFVEKKSSVSMIHYFAQPGASCEVCDEHKDTGLLTALFKTQVPSLQMWDKDQKKYLKLEEMISEDDLVVFMGEKIPMFSGSTLYQGTPHRVIVPDPNTERLSMAFLLDVAK